MFTDDFFVANRRRLHTKIQQKLVIIPANGQLQRGGDAAYPFHQDSHFWYLTGVNEPDILLVIDTKGEYLIVPGRSDVRMTFDGQPDHEHLTRLSGIKTILDEKAGWRRLTAEVKKTSAVATLAALPEYVESWGTYSNPARKTLIERLQSIKSDVEVVDLHKALADMRVIKQPAELQAIRKAIDVTTQTLTAVSQPEQLASYRFEYQLEADISRGFRYRGASGPAFTSIVAAGRHACTMHYIENNGPLHQRDFVIIDVGAEWSHYAADITRTVCIGQPTQRQQAVYDAVKMVQQFAFSLLKPGVDFMEYERQINGFMGQKLQELGLIKTIDPKTVQRFYPHSTSHFLGLDTHDAGDYTRPLAAGMVITVEPGIYISEENIGVRIEDDVLITENGIEILSK